jgi:transketolase
MSTTTAASIECLTINTIRTLSMDAVQQANSGHPGTPMSLAPVGYQLWQNNLRFDPVDPTWPNRDRFVLSVGHASMLIYSLLHLAGVRQVSHGKVQSDPAVSLDEIRRFRQLGSRTPGHPESHLTGGVETTTGPLGQGAANSVGMAIAERWMASYFNRPGFDIVDYNVYALAGDGCLMEGVSAEAASLAGHLKLGNLCWIYDSNNITIEGRTDLAFSEEDVGKRFEAYGWRVLRCTDANDRDQLQRGLDEFKQGGDRPTLIIVNSIIGYGAPHKADTREAHGEPLGDVEIAGAKRFYGWPEDQKFLVPEGVREHFAAGLGARGAKLHGEWNALFARYKAAHPELATQFETMQRGELPAGWDKDIPTFPADAKGIASRDSSGKVLNAVAKNVPWMIGGSADLAPSTKTLMTFEGSSSLTATNTAGRNIHFGVREHAMTAIVNGMVLSKLRGYGAGFLIFSDYARGSLRLSAVMEIPSLFIFTHDSIGVGEDGPTHQPIEHLASLRAMPNMVTIRPGDANEVAEAWRVLMRMKTQPVSLILSRQALPTLDRTKYAAASGLARGGYVLIDAAGGSPDVILIGTGSEVGLCVQAHEQLTAAGVKVRVVSLPCWELFEQQPSSYRESVLPPGVKARVSVEMASTFGWSKYVGIDGASIGMTTFGASAPIKDLQKHFGFTVDAVVSAAKDQLRKAGK